MIDKFFRRLALSIAMLLAVYLIRTAVSPPTQREIFIDNLLVRFHYIIVMIK